jgi:hydroxyacylglutathione hydrolase
MLEIESMVLGPVETNVYLVANVQTGDCVVIDPAWDGEQIAFVAEQRAWIIREIWLTHAHFDHLGGVGDLVKHLKTPPSIALHPADLPLWKEKGGSELFGFYINPGPEPDKLLQNMQTLNIGDVSFQVRHSPGHTPGHVVFYSESQRVVFCGDLIFAGGIGRTDLPGGSFAQLIGSINHQILSLHDDVILYSGHGAPTTVGAERKNNHFLKGFN